MAPTEKIGAVHYSNTSDVVNTYKQANDRVVKTADTGPLRWLKALGVGNGYGYGPREGNLKFGFNNGTGFIDKGGYWVNDVPSFELIC